MPSPTYPLSILTIILSGRDVGDVLPWHELRNDGLYVRAAAAEMRRGGRGFAAQADGTPRRLPEVDIMEWHPRGNTLLPALPNPFTAHDLAALMLAGGGIFLHDEFADDEGRPYEGVLNALGPNADQARALLREALSLRRDVVVHFGPAGEPKDMAARLLSYRPIRSVEPIPMRQDRRLQRFYELGGELLESRQSKNGWIVDRRRSARGALAKLAREEKAARNPQHDDKEIREDLAAAMYRRKRAG